ncbi:MAG: hypothetical protein ACAI44_17515 [Candidatus Sericytochromatia bacterium]
MAGKLVCPECGSTRFGSASMPDGRVIRHCHGLVDAENSCLFNWESEDDFLYFYLPLDLVAENKPDMIRKVAGS